jgi:hypothetical protein
MLSKRFAKERKHNAEQQQELKDQIFLLQTQTEAVDMEDATPHQARTFPSSPAKTATSSPTAEARTSSPSQAEALEARRSSSSTRSPCSGEKRRIIDRSDVNSPGAHPGVGSDAHQSMGNKDEKTVRNGAKDTGKHVADMYDQGNILSPVSVCQRHVLKSLHTVTLLNKYPRALTFENVCARRWSDARRRVRDALSH